MAHTAFHRVADEDARGGTNAGGGFHMAERAKDFEDADKLMANTSIGLKRRQPHTCPSTTILMHGGRQV